MHRKFRINAKCLIPTEIVAMKETKSNRLETHKGERWGVLHHGAWKKSLPYDEFLSWDVRKENKIACQAPHDIGAQWYYTRSSPAQSQSQRKTFYHLCHFQSCLGNTAVVVTCWSQAEGRWLCNDAHLFPTLCLMTFYQPLEIGQSDNIDTTEMGNPPTRLHSPRPILSIH